MTLGELKNRIIKRMGNLDSQDLFYDNLGGYANGAVIELITRAAGRDRSTMSLFPEQRYRWKTVTTTADEETVALPSDLLVLDKVYSYDSTVTAGVPAAPADADVRREVIEVTEHEFDIRTRRTGDYPDSYCQVGTDLLVDPIPDADHVTYLLITGIKLPAEVVEDGSDMPVKSMWDEALVDFGSALAAIDQGWSEDAAAWMAAGLAKVQRSLSYVAMGNKRKSARLRIKNFRLRGAR